MFARREMMGKRKRLYRKNSFRMNANITKIALLEMFYEHLPNHFVIYLHLIALRYEYNLDDLNTLVQEKHWKRCRTNVNFVVSNEFREVELAS